jgi:hypothetical protein
MIRKTLAVEVVGSRLFPHGTLTAPQNRFPLWKRFSWNRFRELMEPPPRPKDPIGTVVERARNEIPVADAFLKTGQSNPSIHIDRSRGSWSPPASPRPI